MNKAFSDVCRLLAVMLLGVLLLALPRLASAESSVVVLDVQDAIGPASADYMIRGIAKAAEAGAPLVVIRLDTPGGLDTSMRKTIQAILASTVPVAIYVSPEGARAASAGTYMLYAAHVAAMAPATTLGAATPVAIGLPGGSSRKPPDQTNPTGGEADKDQTGKPVEGKNGRDDKSGTDGKAQDGTPIPLTDAMTAKQVHDASAFIRGLAQLRGRNAEWAERAVREAVSLTAIEALRDKVVDVIADDIPDLLAQIDGRTVRVAGAEVKLATRGMTYQTAPPDWRQRLLSVIANPSFALILLMIGIYGLIFEFSSPGFGVAGTVGAICLLLAAFALQMMPTNYVGLGLIVLGIGLLVAEVLSPTFGVLGVGGVVAFIAGALLLFDRDIPGFGVPLPLIFSLAASSAAVVLLGGGMALRAYRRPLVSGHTQMIGRVGEVVSSGPGGSWALIDGENWRVEGPAQLQPGQRVQVRAINGLVLQVGSDDPANNSNPEGKRS